MPRPTQPSSFFKDIATIIGMAATAIILVLLLYSVLQSCNDARSIKELSDCYYPKLIGVQTMKYGRRLYHYQCADGRIIDSTIQR